MLLKSIVESIQHHVRNSSHVFQLSKVVYKTATDQAASVFTPDSTLLHVSMQLVMQVCNTITFAWPVSFSSVAFLEGKTLQQNNSKRLFLVILLWKSHLNPLVLVKFLQLIFTSEDSRCVDLLKLF